MNTVSIANFLPFILTSIPLQIIISISFLSIPFMILNALISKRKGRNTIKYVLLSFIPIVGLCLAIYLNSFLDKAIENQIDEIHKKLKLECG